MDTRYQTTKDGFQTIRITAMALWKDSVSEGHMEENPGVKTSLKDVKIKTEIILSLNH